MKKTRFLGSVAVLFLASALVLSACTQTTGNTGSGDVSSEITVSESATSIPKKEDSSSKQENSSQKENSSNQTSNDKLSSDILENITITPPIPKKKKQPTVSSAPEIEEDYEIDLEKYQPQETELDRDKKRILGSWSFDYDVSYLLTAEGYTVTEPVVVKYCYEFIDAYTCALYPSKQDYYDKIGPFMIPGIERQLIAELKKDWITEAEFKQIMGVTVKEYAAYIFSETVKYMPATKMGYIFRDGKLCIKDPETNQYDRYDYCFVDDNNLTITKIPFEHNLKRVIKQDTTTE